MDQLESDIPIMLGGDWNLVLEQERDSYNYRRLNNVRAQRRVLDMINKFDLVDVFRERCPSLNRYTWRVKNPSLKQARLDFFLVSSSMNEQVVGCDIKPGYRTDHSMLELDMIVVDQTKGHGLYKFNISLLKDREYVKIVKRTIMNSVTQYALPVYDIEYLKTVQGKKELLDVSYRISDALLYETIMLNIRTETITYGIYKKKQMRREERAILKEIEKLEARCNEQPTRLLADELSTKHEELHLLSLEFGAYSPIL